MSLATAAQPEGESRWIFPRVQPRAMAKPREQLTKIMQYITPDDNSQQKTIATTAPADCPAHRERPQYAITVAIKIIRDQKMTAHRAERRSSCLVARHGVSYRMQFRQTEFVKYNMPFKPKNTRVRRFKSAGSL